MRTLAVGSLSLMALAAANEAVPPPMRTYGTFSEAVVRDGAIQRQSMRCVQKTTHTERQTGEGDGKGRLWCWSLYCSLRR